MESDGRRSSAGSENGGVMIADSGRQGELTPWDSSSCVVLVLV